MTGTEIALIIGQLAVLVTSIGGFIVMTRRADQVDGKIEEIHKATNSLTDRLVESTAKESHAAGIKEEKDRHRDP